MNKETRKRAIPESPAFLFFTVFVLALAARLIFLLEINGSPLFDVPVIDADTYSEHAKALAETGGFRDGFFWQGFFYPFVLAGLYRVFGYSVLAAKSIQLIIGSLTAALVFLAGRRLFGSKTGVVAGAICALYGPMMAFEAQLLATCWASLWSVSLVLLLIHARHSEKPALFVLLGSACAAAIITRATFIPFAAAALVWLFAARKRAGDRWPSLAGNAAAALAGLLVILLPVSFLSLEATGEFSPIPQSGSINLYIGNNPEADKTIMIRPGMGWRELVREPMVHGAETNGEKKAYFSGLFYDYVRSDPSGFARGLAFKTAQFLSSRELPRNTDIYLFREFSFLYSALTWKAGGFGFPFGLVLPLALAGLFLRRRSIPAPVWLFLVLYPLSIIMVFVTSRYRAPVIPVLALPAAAAAVWLFEKIKSGSFAAFGAGAAAVALMGSVSSLAGPFPVERVDYEAEMYCNIGFEYYQRGLFDDSVAYLAESLKLDPEYSKANKYLGLALSGMNREEAAAKYFRRALKGEPGSYFLRYYLATSLLELGEREEAVKLLEEALEMSLPYKESLFQARVGELLKRFGERNGSEARPGGAPGAGG